MTRPRVFAQASSKTLDHIIEIDGVVPGGNWDIGDVIEWDEITANRGILRKLVFLSGLTPELATMRLWFTFQNIPHLGTYPVAGLHLADLTLVRSGTIALIHSRDLDYIAEHGRAGNRYALLGSDRPYPLGDPTNRYRANLLEDFRGGSDTVVGADLYVDHSELGLPNIRVGDMRARRSVSQGFAEISRRLEYQGATIRMDTNFSYRPRAPRLLPFDVILTDRGGWVESDAITGALYFRVPPGVARVDLTLNVWDDGTTDSDETTSLEIYKNDAALQDFNYIGSQASREWGGHVGVYYASVPTIRGERFTAAVDKEFPIVIADYDRAEFSIRAVEYV